MPSAIHLKDISALVGTELGLSRWFTVDQTMIDRFAEATEDHQFIHTDPVRAAAETPFGGTIAHGFLTLSLLSAMNYDCIPRIVEQTMGINYGFDKVRFMSPVKTGARVRARFKLADADIRPSGRVVNHYDVTLEIENSVKPALTATWLTIAILETPAA